MTKKEIKFCFGKVKNIEGKRENSGQQNVLFCPRSSTVFKSLWPQARYKLGVCVNPLPNKLWFLRVCSINHLKTLWE